MIDADIRLPKLQINTTPHSYNIANSFNYIKPKRSQSIGKLIIRGDFLSDTLEKRMEIVVKEK